MTDVMHSIRTLLDRLKLGLKNDTCSWCQQVDMSQQQETLCRSCLSKLNFRDPEPVIPSAYAATQFSLRLKKVLYPYKFQHQGDKAMVLSELLIQYIETLTLDKSIDWVIAPMPPHAGSLYHPVTMLSRPVSSHFGFSFLETALAWRRMTAKQHSILSRRKRRENILGAFRLNDDLKCRLQAKNTGVIVIDDIITTGYTMKEALDTIQGFMPEAPVLGVSLTHVPFMSS
jgi:predicted amidophosphoribosyltransferase